MEVSGQLHEPATLPHRERAPSTQWIGGLVGTRVSLEAVEERKILHYLESNLGHAAHSLYLYQLSYPNSQYTKETKPKFKNYIV
jgi:hypothetical protein